MQTTELFLGNIPLDEDWSDDEDMMPYYNELMRDICELLDENAKLLDENIKLREQVLL